MGVHIGSGFYETLKEAGYSFLKKLNNEYHLLNLETNKIEIFASSPHYAGWAIKYKNTHLEFCRCLK